jgi:cell division protein FtsZ
MREGPLAALFRRTEEESAEGAPKAPADKTGTEATQPPSPAAPGAPTPPPPPGPTAHEDEPEEIRTVPAARERLRNVFAQDIPENILDRPTSRGTTESRAKSAPAPTQAPVASYEPEPIFQSVARPVGSPVIRVVGVGGAGVNAVNRMIEAEVEGVEFVAINTDLQSLQQSAAHITLHIGAEATRGLGSGSNPDLGRQAAMEEFDKVKALIKGADMVFVTAGAGGGTGTGAAPIVARIAKELGSLTIGVVTKPFGFEGSRRSAQADEGIKALADEVDTLIVVPNNRLLSVLDKGTSMVDAFRVADDVLRQGVQGISDLVTLPGLINLDFADVRTIMEDAGSALLGIGMGTGETRAIDAAHQAVASPLLETSMDGARKILLSITGGRDLSLWEVNEAAKAVAEAAHPEANIIFGAMIDEKLDGPIWVTVVATGFEGTPTRRRLEEPRGEPRVARANAPEPREREREPVGEPRRERAVAERSFGGDLDVPEFIPRRG